MVSATSAQRRALLRELLRRRAELPPANELSPAEGPTTYGQRALWHIQQLDPGSFAYNVLLAARVLSPVDAGALERSVESLVERHAALRTVFVPRDGEPVQRVLPSTRCFEHIDASGLGWERIEERLQEEARRPFDLEHGPLFRVLLLSRSGGEHALLLLAHHAVIDFWSYGILVEELHRLYPALAEGRQIQLPPAGEPFAEVARRQHALLAGAEGERLLAYWRRELAPPLPVLDLPTDRPRPAVRAACGDSRALALDGELSRRLKALSRERATTLYTTLLAAVVALLHRYTRQGDVLVGSPAAGRGAETRGVVGFFVNMVVLRGRPRGDLPFDALLEEMRGTVLGALEHQDLPFALLAEKLGAHDPGRSPLFDVAFVLESPRMDRRGISRLLVGEPGARAALGGLTLEALPLPQQEGQFDLNFHLLEVGEEIAGVVPFNRALFDGTTIERMIGHFETLLAGIAEAPQRPLGELPLLAPGERRQLLALAAPAVEAPSGDSLFPEVFSARAKETPGAPALVFEGGTWSYAELDRRAGQLARLLRRRGVGPEVLVGVCLERSAELITAFLGVLKAGAAYVPLDPAYPRERLAHMVEDSGLGLVLCRDGLAASLPVPPERRIDLDTVPLAEAAEPEADLPGPVDPANLAYVIYTSGSTGRPKGVQVSHRGLVNLAREQIRLFGLTPSSRVLQVASPSFDASISEICKTLAAGATLVVAAKERLVPGPDLLRLLRQESITMATLPPSMLSAMRRDDLPALATVVTAGEACSWDLVRAWSRGSRVINAYGPTEATVCATVAENPLAAADEAPRPPVGRPIAHMRVYVVDHRLRRTGLGIPGELLLGGPALARGYRELPGRTAASFVPDPFTEPGSGPGGGRLYRTGDLVRFLPGGDLDFLGRIDHQVKVRGFRVEPGEIEQALRRHPACAEAAVVVQGAGASARLVAFAVPAAGEEGAARGLAEALRDYSKRELPGYMVPSAFEILEALPTTPNGKLDRAALAQRLAAALPGHRPGEPAEQASRHAGGPAAATNAVAGAICRIWAEVLGLEEVPPEVSFFDLGGHSLLVGRLVSRLNEALREELERDLTAVEIFRFPTVDALAAHVAPASVGRGGASARSETTPDPTPAEGPTGADVAIIGWSGRFPGAAGVDELWASLRAGEEGLTDLSAEELEAAGVPPEVHGREGYVARAGVLEDIEGFDAAFFGLNPLEAEILDPQQRLFLECAWEALEDAGYDPRLAGGRVGVYAGAGMNTYLAANLAGNPALEGKVGAYQLSIANDKDFLPTRTSFKLDLTGPSVNVQSACSTSLVAVHLAVRALRSGECEVALAGGVSLRLPHRTGYPYQTGMILSPDGRCRPFDAKAGGTVGGNGAGVVVLKPLARAQADGDRVLAVVKGSAVNNDGASKVGYTAPGVDGQAAVIRTAWADAGVDPASVGYVEAHGTGTELGDPIEIAALNEVFGGAGAPAGSRALGSVKSNLGHLDAAAGVTGLIKAALAVGRGEIPPSLHFEEPNPKIDFAGGPFAVCRELSAWPAVAGPRRAGVSSFGIGGTNAHVVLESAPEPELPDEAGSGGEIDSGEQLLVLSARDEAALEAATARLAAHFEEHPELPFADVAYTLQAGRRPFERRRALVCRGRVDALAALAGPEGPDPSRLLSGRASGRRGVAFLFPGQGAQYPGMGEGLYRGEPVFRRWVDAGAEVLEPRLGFDLRELLFPAVSDADAAAERLEQTAFTQPALAVVEHALARLWMSWGVAPEMMIGHSVGEYVAAVLAGVFSFEDALALVAERGRLIQELPGGAMLSAALDPEELEPLLPAGVSVAAVNAPGLTVVSGPTEAVEELERRLAARGGEDSGARRLHVSHAFHSAMMDPVLESFRELVAAVERRAPERTFISNVTGRPITAEEATDPDYWVRHLRGTVRFADGVGALLGDGGPALLEVGPGKTLSTFARQSAAARREAGGGAVLAQPSLRHPKDEVADRSFLLGAAGRLWLAGVELDWQAFHGGARRRRVALPTYPFQRQRFWVDPPAHRIMAPASALGGPSRRKPPEEWLYQPVWRSAPRPLGGEMPAEESAAEAWVLFTDGVGLGEELCRRLRRMGVEPVTVEPAPGPVPEPLVRLAEGAWALDPADPRGYEALLGSLEEAPALRLVHLWGVTPEGSGLPSPETARSQVRLGFESLLALSGALAADSAANGGRPVGLEVVTSNVQRVDGREAIQAEKATALGVCRVLPLEQPQVRCGHLDVALGSAEALRTADIEALAAQLLGELLSRERPPEVALRGGERWLPALGSLTLPEAAPEPAPPVREGGVYLVTGGLGGLGLASAEMLAEAAPVRLVLVGRTQLPEEGERAAALGDPGTSPRVKAALEGLERLREAGAEVLVECADVADQAQVAAVLERARRSFGALHGVLHAAGVAGGGVLESRDPAASAAVLAPKVEGTRILDRLLAGEELDFFVLFSSLSSTLGGIGQGDYCAANAFLDALSQEKRRAGRPSPVLSIGWDAWREVGMAASAEVPEALRALRERSLERGLSTAEGRQVLSRLLGCGLAQVLVSTTDIEARRAEAAAAPGAAPAASGAPAAHERPDLATAFVPPRSEVEETVAGVWQDMLGLAAVGVHDDFFELGGHSLLGTQILARLREAFAVDLPLSALFKNPTVAALSAALAERVRSEPAEALGPPAGVEVSAQPESTGEDPELLEGFEDLEGLSDENVTALLAGTWSE